MRMLVIVAAVMAVFMTSPAATQEDQPCTPAVAVAATVEQINANFDEWRGRCVRVRAIHAFGEHATRNLLLADRLAILETPGMFEPHKRALAIDFTELEHPRHRPAWEDVVGRVGSCQDRYDAARARAAADPDYFSWVSGLCHYTVSNFVVPVAYDAVDAPPVARLVPADVPPGLAGLYRITPEDAALSGYLTAADRVLQALDRDDEREFVRIVAPDLAADLDRYVHGGEPGWLIERTRSMSDHFQAARSSFLRAGRPQRGEVAVFVPERPPEEDTRRVVTLTGPELWSEFYLCRCKGPDCSELWPVTPLDADNDSDRPYFCLEARDFVSDGETVVSVTVPLPNKGFAEPRL